MAQNGFHDDEDDHQAIQNFWGLVLQPGNTYSQVVESSFRLTMAALGAFENADSKSRSMVTVTVDKTEHVLCSLRPVTMEQHSLDHVFSEGESVTFAVTGKIPVHLTGYYLPPEPGMYEDMDDLDDEELDSEDMDDYDSDEDSEDMDEDEDEDEEDFSDEDDDMIMPSAAAKPGDKRKALPAPTAAPPTKKAAAEQAGKPAAQPVKEEKKPQQAQQKTPNANEKKTPVAAEKKTPAAAEKKTPAAAEKKTPTAAEKKTPAAEEKKTPATAEKKTPAAGEKKAEESKTPGSAEPKKKTLNNGLTIEDTVVGTGKKAKKGRPVSVRYVGKLDNGKVFDKNTDGKPFTFTLGKGEVIKGWDMGVEGMNEGGTRTLIVPPALGYGAAGAPPSIPKNARLTFEVKLLSVK